MSNWKKMQRNIKNNFDYYQIFTKNQILALNSP